MILSICLLVCSSKYLILSIDALYLLLSINLLSSLDIIYVAGLLLECPGRWEL